MQREWKIVTVTSIASAISALDLTLMFVAFPEIRADFPDVPTAEVSWVLTSFSIVAAALLIPAGRIADRIGRKKVFVASLWLFSAGALSVSLAPTVPLLIASRVVQAVGGAMLTPSALAIIMGSTTPERRATALGAWSAISGVVASLAPTIGAVAISAGSWRWAFAIVVPIGVACALASARMIDEHIDDNARALPDPIGSLCIAVGVASLSYAVVRSPDWGWVDRRTLLLLAVAATAIVVFISRCRTHPSPVIDLALFSTRAFRANGVAALAAGVSFWGIYYVLVAFLTKGWGERILVAGLLLTPMSLAATVTSMRTGRLIDRLGPRALMVPAGLMFGAGLLVLLVFAGDDTSYLVWFPAAFLLGTASATYLTGANSAATRAVPPEHLGSVAGVVQTLIRVGGVLGTAVGIALVGEVRVGDPISEFHRALWTLAAVGGVAALAAWPLHSRRRSVPAAA